MVAPLNFLHVPFRPRQATPIDLQEVTLSPAEALSHLSKLVDGSPRAQSIGLKKIAQSVIYEINLANGGSYLLEAQTGQLFTMTPEIAEEIARDYVSSSADVLETDLTTLHSYAYSWGPLPAFRIVFNHDPSTAYYVSVRDGNVLRSDRWSRIHGAIESLHVFQPLKLFTQRESIRKGLLVLLSAVGIGTAVTGYYLAFPRRRR